MVSTLGVVGGAAVGTFPVAGSADPLRPGLFVSLDGQVLTADAIQARTLQITEALGGTKTLALALLDEAGGHGTVGQRLLVRHDTVNIFLGTIASLDEQLLGAAMVTRVQGVDLGAMLERRLVTQAESFLNQASGAIVRSLAEAYLDGEALTLNSVLDGPTVADFTVAAFESVAKALRNLSDVTGLIWFVDAAGDLHWQPQSEVAAPFVLGDEDSAGVVMPERRVRVSATRERYRNRQTVVYGDPELSVTVNDLDEQAARRAVEGGSGIYHDVRKESTITTAAEATALAEALLRRFGSIPQKVTAAIRTPGLKAGQALPVTLTRHGIDATYLIDRLTIRDIGGGQLEWEATAVSGEHLGDEMSFWRSALGKG
jgi:hypothetical protein